MANGWVYTCIFYHIWAKKWWGIHRKMLQHQRGWLPSTFFLTRQPEQLRVQASKHFNNASYGLPLRQLHPSRNENVQLTLEQIVVSLVCSSVLHSASFLAFPFFFFPFLFCLFCSFLCSFACSASINSWHNSSRFEMPCFFSSATCEEISYIMNSMHTSRPPSTDSQKI